MSRELITSGLLRTAAPIHDNAWHVIHDGREFGPLSQDMLVELAETGRIEADDLVKESDGEWIKASDVPILQRQFSLGDIEKPESTPAEILLAGLVRYQSYIAGGFFAIVIVIGVGIGAYGSLSGVRDIAGTTWQGSENLERFGYLSFDFRPNGTVIMTDAAHHIKGKVQGKWMQSGSNVTIVFSNCEYRGTIQNATLTGNATFAQIGKTWSFSVSKR